MRSLTLLAAFLQDMRDAEDACRKLDGFKGWVCGILSFLWNICSCSMPVQSTRLLYVHSCHVLLGTSPADSHCPQLLDQPYSCNRGSRCPEQPGLAPSQSAAVAMVVAAVVMVETVVGTGAHPLAAADAGKP